MKAVLRSLRSDFRALTTLAVALVGLLMLTPFSINNFSQGRVLLGSGSLLIVAILAFNAWTLLRGRHYPLITELALVPAIIFFLNLSIRDQQFVGVLWCFPALICFYFMLHERKAWLANAVLLAIVYTQVWAVFDPPIAARITVSLLAVSVFSAVFMRIISAQQARLTADAVTDPLTGVANRALLPTALEQAVEQSHRSATPVSVVTIDVDNFKLINDTRGHDAGDRVLQGLGELFRQRVRRADKVFRLGGEEFLLLLHGTDSANAYRVAEELRCAISALPLLPDGGVTVSSGVATLRTDESWQQLVKRSDANLYRAKSTGRDRVMA